ncbi:type IV toxin-antitoxin system AbiEi family antitoxin domain-containing protein [Candidatus Margulisiibacteriota bacterium]
MKTHQEEIIKLLKKQQIIRPRDLKQIGVPPVSLSRMLKHNLIQKIGRGLYASIDYSIEETQDLVEVVKRVPSGIICLLSALQYYNISTQNPFEVWIAIENKAHMPLIDNPPIRVLRFSGKALNEGINKVNIKGVEVKIYSLEKTIVDCFKYRNKIGIDVCIEALKDALRQKKISLNKLSHFAKICRVTNILNPYIEAIIQ